MQIFTTRGECIFSDGSLTMLDAVEAATKQRANLKAADLKDAYLRAGNFKMADLRFADLRGADLVCADLKSADLRGADLRNAELAAANFSSARLMEANLRGAYLSSADLRNADLRGANLTWACLIGADLRGSDLDGACLIGADLRRAKLQGVVNLPFPTIQIRGSRDLVVASPDGQVTVGCKNRAIEEWLRDGPKIGREHNYSEEQIQEYMAYFRLIQALLRHDAKSNK